MKKLLAMLIVVGLAGIAYADPVMSFDLVPTEGQSGHGFSETDPLLPSEWVELDVVYNSAGATLFSSGMLYIELVGPGEWCGDNAGTYDPPGLPIEDVWTYHETFDPDYYYMGMFYLPGFVSMTKVDSQHIEIGGNQNSQASSIGVAPGSVIFDHLNVHCTGPGPIEVILTPATSTGNPVGTPQWWDGTVGHEDIEALGSSIMIYNDIPEPMTMALLGLGGLGLLRRRR